MKLDRRSALAATARLVASAFAGNFLLSASATQPGNSEGALNRNKPDTAPIRNQALLVVDPYNDFLSKTGRAWPLLRSVARRNNFVSNMLRVTRAAREHDVPVAFAPHQRYRENMFADRRFLTPSQFQQIQSKTFSSSEEGGEFYEGLAPLDGEIVAREHSSSSGFAETDLHAQLTADQVSHLMLIGCISNTCIEATVRSAVDLGYHVTVVADAIAAFSPIEHKLAIDHSLTNMAHALTTSDDLIAAWRRNRETGNSE